MFAESGVGVVLVEKVVDTGGEFESFQDIYREEGEIGKAEAIGMISPEGFQSSYGVADRTGCVVSVYQVRFCRKRCGGWQRNFVPPPQEKGGQKGGFRL